MVFCTYAQIPGHTNFPPTGIKSSVNKYKYIDYSFKLNQAKGNEPIEKRWIYKFSDSDFKKLKNSNQKLYDYYSTASNYFQNLSDKVKSIYTLEELWYIYMYDQPLKNKLATIK
jgi:hypothetical protein